MRLVSLFAAVALVTPAFAQDSATPPAPKPERKICRAVQSTGSILGGKKECHTKSEWRSLDDRDQSDRENRTRRDGGFDRSDQAK